MHTKKLPSGKLRYTLTNDYLFHIVFQRNTKILRGLLCSLLNLSDDEIVDIYLENPIDPGEKVDDKTVILDLLITLNNNRKINIEMQLLNRNDWPERSLIYLCRSFNNLTAGQDYIDVMPTIHIGILDFTLFPEYPEFYARYAMKNIKNDNIYSDKLLLNVLDLNQTHLATEEDIQSGLAYWARLFKTETWEDLQMLASEYRDFEDIPDTMQKALEDKKIRLQCEARERYERDRTSLYNCGKRDGISEGIDIGKSEGANIERNEGIKKLLFILQKAGISQEFAKEQLIEQYKLPEAVADEKLDLYWK